ncbi:MAG: DUF503 domain-containing protein [Myxococcota bacterium]
MHVGLCEITLRLPPGVKSLKDKRSIVRKITHRIRNRHPVSMAETGDADVRDRAKLGFAIVGQDRNTLDGQIDRALAEIRELYLAQVIHVEREIFAWTEGYDHHELF